jgi:MoaA/NifB/PqqE/SkfB family radical SAM enzyme
MGDRLERGLSLSLEDARRIIRSCRKLGAEYITFLGGEPTLYRDLPAVVAYANECGYQQVMLDTNGLNPKRILSIPPPQLYYVTVSLDGASATTHDRVRGAGTFERTVSAIGEFVSRGYRVRINCTVFKFTLHEAPALLGFAERAGVKLVNFHTFSEEGLGIGKTDWSLTPDDWIGFYESLEAIKDRFSVSVWYPPTWAKRSALPHYVDEGFRGCLGCSLDRLSIFPDGRCYVCSVLFDRAVHFATMTADGLILNREKNEYNAFSKAMAGADESWLSGCPAEDVLNEQGKPPTPDTFVSMCRCWKAQV